MKRMEELEVRKVDETKIKSENEIMRLKRKELKAKNERNNIFYLSLVIILLLIVTGAIYRHNNIKKAHNLQQSINEELNRSVEFKNRLLSILAHDIRNPINGLTGIISLFKDDTLDEDEFKTLTAKLEGTTRNVSLLLENILNWIKAQGKGFDVRLSEFSLVELITEVEKQNSAELDRKSIEIIKKLDKIEGFIKSDYNMVSLIVRNVIANAIKFTPKNNSIEVSYASTNRFHNIIINDHGVGMTEDQLQGLFNTTSSALGTNNEGGTGLGLTLCFDIIKELNGKIEVESERGKGTAVTI
jgi:signal transduction histidine kinase